MFRGVTTYLPAAARVWRVKNIPMIDPVFYSCTKHQAHVYIIFTLEKSHTFLPRDNSATSTASHASSFPRINNIQTSERAVAGPPQGAGLSCVFALGDLKTLSDESHENETLRLNPQNTPGGVMCGMRNPSVRAPRNVVCHGGKAGKAV